MEETKITYTDTEKIEKIEQAPEELQTKVAKAFIREDISDDQVQYTFVEDDDFYKACQADANVTIEDVTETDVDGIGSAEDEGIGSAYAPRTTAPSTSDKNWLHYTNGGYNYCIKISGSSCLPNCVGYAWGRWRELLGKYHNLSRANAENWYGNTRDGYSRGQTPKLGAVICWRKGAAGNASDGAGHVAIVERINSDGSITTSNSNYGGTRFYMATYKYPYNVGSSYTFQGFIYNPNNYDGGSSSSTPSKPSTPSVDTSNGYTGKFNIGDKVTINGPLYASSTALNPTGNVSNKVTNITRVAKNTAHPYNTTGDLGWMNESSITKYVEPTPAPKPDTSLHVGDTVKIIGTGNGSSYGNSNTAYGIGWTRQVLKIWDGRPYPYQVGNNSGTTGFYAASALQKQ